MCRTPRCNCHDGSRSIKKKKNYGCLLNRYEYDCMCAAGGPDTMPLVDYMATLDPLMLALQLQTASTL